MPSPAETIHLVPSGARAAVAIEIAANLRAAAERRRESYPIERVFDRYTPPAEYQRVTCGDCGAELQVTAYGLRCPWARDPGDCGLPYRRTVLERLGLTEQP